MSFDQRLTDVFKAVFGIEQISDSDSPETIAKWDSVQHIHLIMSLEAEFDIQFDPSEIGELVSVRAIRERINGEGSPREPSQDLI